MMAFQKRFGNCLGFNGGLYKSDDSSYVRDITILSGIG